MSANQEFSTFTNALKIIQVAKNMEFYRQCSINKIQDGIRQVRTHPSLRCVGICTGKSEGRAGKQCKCKGYIGADGDRRCIFHGGVEGNFWEIDDDDEDDDSNSDWNSGDEDSGDEDEDRDAIEMVIAGIYEVRNGLSAQCEAITSRGKRCKCSINFSFH